MKHPLIIGAGGVASYLLPVLLKTFRPESLTIVDKDILEERNLDRQLFSSRFVGYSKADALMFNLHGEPAAINHETGPIWPKGQIVIKEWFTDMLDLPENIDCIICVADNHLARKHALERADTLRIPCFIGGNEYLDNEAYAYYPRWKGTDADPRTRYPEIVSTDGEDSPAACTGVAQQSSPQLAVANIGCAAKLLHLLWVWTRFVPANPTLTLESINALPYELFTGLSRSNVLSISNPGK